MIIRSGVNIYPEEIEATLMAHPAVAEAAVIGVPDQVRGEEVVAFILLRHQASDDELRAWCRERLAPYKQPRDFLRIDALPLNSCGKVQKPLLKTRLAKSTDRVKSP